MLTKIALIVLGSALGGLARWSTGLLLTRWLEASAFPWPTLFINLSGSLLLGWFLTVHDQTLVPLSDTTADHLRLLIAIGFTGAYTTFSTFEHETYRLIVLGESWLGLLYVGLSVMLGLLAVKLGVLLGRWHG